MRLRLVLVVASSLGALLALVGCGSRGCGAPNPLLEAIRVVYPELGEVLLVEFSTWEAQLGPARTVAQLDEGHTYFYWPEAGIAVFTHPLYGGQYARRPLHERKVTSVLIPFQRTLAPRVPPVAADTRVQFQRLLDFPIGNKPLAALTLDDLLRITPGRVHRRSAVIIDIRPCCLPMRPCITTRIHLQNGGVSEVELWHEGSIFSYD